MWYITNIKKDEDLENQKLKLVLMHILPQAYANKENEEVVVSTEYIKDIEESLGRPLTDEERKALEVDPDMDLIG